MLGGQYLFFLLLKSCEATVVSIYEIPASYLP